MNLIEIGLNAKITHASSIAAGTSQYSGDGAPKIIVDSQHNTDGKYEHTIKLNKVMTIPQTICFSYESRVV